MGMNICVIAPSALRTPPAGDMYGGIERQAQLEVIGLSELGHTVHLIARGDSVKPPNGKLYAITDEKQIPEVADSILQEYSIDVFIDESHDKLLSEQRHDYPQISRYEVMSLMGNPTCPVLISDGQRKEKFNNADWPILPQMIDLDILTFNDGERDDYLVYMGQKITEKRIQWACEVSVKTNTPLYIFGPGWGQAECHEEIRQYAKKYPTLIYNEGEIGGAEKIARLKYAKALIHMPGALDWTEAGAIVALEALACGTPVIASRNGCLPEYIEGKNNGFICNTIQEACDAVGKVSTISPRACRDSVQSFDYHAIAKQWESLCVRVANGERWNV